MAVARVYRDGLFSHLIPWPSSVYQGENVLIAYGLCWFDAKLVMGAIGGMNTAGTYCAYGLVPDVDVPKEMRLFNLLME